ncbi:MAG: hypothetical protein ACPGVD_02100 [Flavobacteriales bacterium]
MKTKLIGMDKLAIYKDVNGDFDVFYGIRPGVLINVPRITKRESRVLFEIEESFFTLNTGKCSIEMAEKMRRNLKENKGLVTEEVYLSLTTVKKETTTPRWWLNIFRK